MTHKTAYLFNTNFPEDGSRVTDSRQGGFIHISKKSLVNIKSPLDRLIEEQNTDNKTFTSINS